MEAVLRSRQVVLWFSAFVTVLYVVGFQVQTVKCQSFQYKEDLFYKTTSPFCVELPGPLRSGKIIKIMGSFENITDVTGSQKDDETTDDTGPQEDDELQYLLRNSFGHRHRGLSGDVNRFLRESRRHRSSRVRTGTVKPNTQLKVTLLSRCLSPETPFQFTVRFDNKTVTRNSFENGNWGEEKIEGPFPFSLGAQFLLLIEVQPDGYVVKGNGVPLWTFAHRSSFDDVKYLNVEGNRMFIPKIELVDPNIKGEQHSQLIYPVPLTKPVLHPTSPFWGQFAEELQAGKAIRIKGYFPTKPDRAAINLCADCFKGPVMLHLDIRFKHSIDTLSVVRNSYINGKWKEEERGGPFPFSVGESFDLIIHITPQSFNISVNNKHCWTFTHRLPYTEISSLCATRNMNIWKIEYIDFPEKKQSSLLMRTEEPDLNNSSAASVYSNIVYIIHALSFFLFLKAM